MTILFAGGELDDFTVAGSTTFVTDGTGYRTTYARGALALVGTTGGVYATASFTASAAFSFTTRFYVAAGATAAPWLSFNTGGNQRLRLKSTGSTPTTIILETYNGSSAVTLATSTLTITNGVSYKLDVVIDYQTSGRVRVYIDQVLYIDFTGNPIVSGATTLDSVTLQPHYGSGSFASRYSEIIVCTQDSRTLSLATLAPNAAGTTSSWTGAYTDIDETTASDVDVLTSATAMQVTSVNCTGMPSGWSNLTVTAVKVVASAARGSTGPSKLALGVRTNSTDSFPTATTLDTGFSAPITTTYELNPVTGIAWTTAEVDALQLAFRSET